MEKKTTSVVGQVIFAIAYVIGSILVMVAICKAIDAYFERVYDWISNQISRIKSRKARKAMLADLLSNLENM